MTSMMFEFEFIAKLFKSTLVFMTSLISVCASLLKIYDVIVRHPSFGSVGGLGGFLRRWGSSIFSGGKTELSLLCLKDP